MLSDDVHLGVATCAGSNCHGSVKPFKNSPVRQNEYFTWERHDRHARAFETLREPRSARIAKNLGLRDATTAKECLVCHSDYVPPDKRGARFLLSDGVGCEACHGGSERWLGPHVSGKATHADNLALGLYPTEQPKARAELCLGCHQGDAAHPMTHAIMGAGHPPLVFELDTFTSIQPAHYDVDDDYRQRKTASNTATTWAVGQVTAAVAYLELVEQQADQSSGLFPELYPFDCNACHHDMDSLRWSETTSDKPGSVRLRDVHLRNAGLAIGLRDANKARQWDASLRRLNEASQQSRQALRDAAKQFRQTAGGDALKLVQPAWNVSESRKLFGLLSEQHASAGVGYTQAEQGAMALAGLAAQTSDSRKPAVTGAIQALYNTVDNRADYDPAVYGSAVRALQSGVKDSGQ